MLSKIKVYGKLARFVGQRTFEAEINNTVDAIRFLIANYPRLQSHMLEQNYFIKVGEYQIDDKELDMPIGQQDIKIVPVAIGAGRGFGKFLGGALLIGVTVMTGGFGGAALTLGASSVGLGSLAVGVGASLMLGGASEMLFPTPKPPGVSDDPRELNFSFSGVQNTSRAGTAIPIVYGEIFCGSLVVSAGLDSEDLI